MSTTEQEITVRDMVAEAVAKTSDPEKATRLVLARLARSKGDQDAWNKETVAEAVSTMVHEKRGNDRAVTVNASWLDGDAPAQLEAPVLRSMLDYYTVGAKRLGDCVADDLATAREQAETQRKGFAVKVAFFAMLSDRIGNKRVRDMFNDRTIVELHRAAEGATQ